MNYELTIDDSTKGVYLVNVVDEDRIVSQFKYEDKAGAHKHVEQLITRVPIDSARYFTRVEKFESTDTPVEVDSKEMPTRAKRKWYQIRGKKLTYTTQL